MASIAGTVESGLTLAVSASGAIAAEIIFPNPQLWSPDSPSFIVLSTKVISIGTEVD